MKGGAAGTSKLLVKGKNNQAKGQVSLPTGIAGELFGGASATVQLMTSDADCFSMTLTNEKKNESDFFKFKLP